VVTGSGDGASQVGAAQANRESATERTAVITDPVGAPVHARSSERAAPGGGEQARADGGSNRDRPWDVPPWQRGGSARSDQPTRSIDVGQPKHGNRTPESASSSDTERAFAFSAGPVHGIADAPTGYVEPVEEPVADERPPDDVGYDQPTVRAEQPVFEHGAPAASRPSTTSTSTRVRSSRVPRRASLQLKHFDPWSVLKVSVVLSVAGFLAWMVAVGVLYGILEGMGVWDQLNGTYSDLTSVTNPQAGDDLISAGRVFSIAAVVGAINIVLLTGLATVGAFIYNVSSDLAGGIELTLSERD